MCRFTFIIFLSVVAVAAKANLPEPLNSYKNAYISCVNVIVSQTLNTGEEVTEPLLQGACPNELASLITMVPKNMEAAFLEQLRNEVQANLYKQLTLTSQ